MQTWLQNDGGNYCTEGGISEGKKQGWPRRGACGIGLIGLL